MHPIPALDNSSTIDLPGAFAVEVLVDSTSRSRLRARGELDLASAPALAAALDEQLRSGRRHVHVDLSEVGFCDATGLAVLVEAHRGFLSREGSLTLIGVSARVRRLLTITGLDGVLRTETRGAPGSIAPQHAPTKLRGRLPRPLVRVRRPA